MIRLDLVCNQVEESGICDREVRKKMEEHGAA